MKAIFPAEIDGDLLKLVHLTNGFRMIPGQTPLQVGDVCQAEAKIISVINNDSGKVVKVKGSVNRHGAPVIEVTSSFLYRGNFTDYENTFEIVEEPPYVVEITSKADVAVLQSKEWFEWKDETKPLLPGTKLIFKVTSEYTYKDKVNFAEVEIEGEVFVRNHLRELIPVAYIDHEQGPSQGNVVTAYLQRHGVPEARLSKFENGGYHMTSSKVSSRFFTPLTNEPYSKISGDFNPIHINPYFSNYASLPGTITHGMWSSAATRRYIEDFVAEGRPERVTK